MKACVLHGVGDLRYEEAPAPVPGDGEALIAVRACGVCGSDIPRIFSKGTYRFPTIPGHEFAGEVAGVGPGVDRAWVGRRVAVFPLVPCRRCAACEQGAYAQCAEYDYLGSRSDGAFAEYVRAPVWNLIPLPEGVSFEEAAMTEPAAVAAHAVRRGEAALGDTVLVLGAGPIGLLAGLWARVSGAERILMTDIDERRLAFARTLGFEMLCDAGKGDTAAWVRDLTGRGADLAIEASGSAAACEQALHAAAPFGRVVLLGNPAGAMGLSQEAYWSILRKELTVRGSWNSYYGQRPENEWRLALDAMASKRIDVRPLVTHRVGLNELHDALAMMRDAGEFSVKVLYVNDSAAP